MSSTVLPEKKEEAIDENGMIARRKGRAALAKAGWQAEDGGEWQKAGRRNGKIRGKSARHTMFPWQKQLVYRNCY